MRFVLLLLISGCLLFATDDSVAWQQQKSPEEGITVWTEAGSAFDKVRVEADINAPLLPLLALLQDPAEQLNWFPYLKKVEMIKRLSPTQTLVHIQTGSAWLVKARDAITLFTVSQPGAGVIDIEMQNRPDAIPELKGFKRVQTSFGHWQLTALPGCKTRTRFEAGSQWGGAIPQWLADKSNVDVAIETIVNLGQWAPAHYRNYQPYDFLQVPAVHEKCD